MATQEQAAPQASTTIPSAGGGSGGAPTTPEPQIGIEEIDAGLPAETLAGFLEALELSAGEAAPLFGVSPRTLKRYLKRERLDPRASDLLARYLRLYEQALGAFSAKERAVRWFKRPHVHFGHKTPLEMMRYDPGAEAVENLAGAIKHGVYY